MRIAINNYDFKRRLYLCIADGSQTFSYFLQIAGRNYHCGQRNIIRNTQPAVSVGKQTTKNPLAHLPVLIPLYMFEDTPAFPVAEVFQQFLVTAGKRQYSINGFHNAVAY